MSKAKLDGEARVEEFLLTSGLQVERYTKAQLRQGRTPDFRIFGGDELAFFCEVKTAQEDEWLDKQFSCCANAHAGGRRATRLYLQSDQLPDP